MIWGASFMFFGVVSISKVNILLKKSFKHQEYLLVAHNLCFAKFLGMILVSFVYSLDFRFIFVSGFIFVLQL